MGGAADPVGLYDLLDQALTLAGWPVGSGPTVQLWYVVCWALGLWGLVLIGRTFRKDW